MVPADDLPRSPVAKPLEAYEQPPQGDSAVIDAVVAGEPTMWCDRPDLSGGSEVRTPVELAGWATSPTGIEAVLVSVDGGAPLRAATSLDRPEMTPLLGERIAAECGFFIRLDPSDCPAGRRTLTVVATTGDGRALGMSGAVECLRPRENRLRPNDSYEAIGANADGGGAPAAPTPEHIARYAWAATTVVGERVLDAGCGIGRGTAILARGAREAVGVDLSPAAITEARREHGESADFREADMRKLPFGEDEFDVVVCFEAITHVAEPEHALEELSRVLRPHGLLIVSAPNRESYPPGNPLQLSELSSTELGDLLESRFANTIVCCQHPYYASLLCTTHELEHVDTAQPIDAETIKATGGPRGSELYAVAMASDGELPQAPAGVVLGEQPSYDELRRELAEWQERTVNAEVRVSELERQALTERYERLTWQRRAAELDRAPDRRADGD